jgi:hypothetical protein
LMMRVQDILEEEKIPCVIDTTSPYELETLLDGRTVDLIVSTTPLTDMRGIKCPVIHGHALLSGIGEDEVVERIRTEGRKIVDAHDKPN